MKIISAAIYELFQTGTTTSEIFRLLKLYVSRSDFYKVLKYLTEIGSTLPKVKSTPSERVRTSNFIDSCCKTSEIFKKA